MHQSKPYQLLSPLTVDEYDMLKNDIRHNGIIYPVVYDECGNVLDGHHRLQIVAELRAEGIRIDVPAIIRVGLSESEKRALALSLNLARRHTTQAQRRELIAARLIAAPDSADTIIARTLGVTDKTVAAMRRYLEARSEIPTVTERMRSDGKTCPSKPTMRSVVAKDQREMNRVLAALPGTRPDGLPNRMMDVRYVERTGREARAVARAKNSQDASICAEGVDIRLGDFREVLRDIAPGTADMILTDAPYDAGALPLWSDLGEFASRILKPGGILVTYTGQTFMPDVMASLAGYLRYVWTIAVTGSARESSNHNLHVFGNWKPILVYAKPPYQAGKWYSDLIRGNGQEKSEHPWQQALTESSSLIETFTEPGDLVLDSFCGSGTTAVACVLKGRRCICADVDATAVATSRERVRLALQNQQ